MIAKTVIYFTTNATPAASEVAAIARLGATFETVLARNGAASGTAYGSGLLELADYVAGTNIPAAYSSAYTTITVPSAVNPDQFALLPATLTIDASNVDVQQLVAVKSAIDATTGLATITDLSADATVTYASSDATKATIGATGVLTAVAAGSTTITATLQAVASITGINAEADDDLFTKSAHGLVTGDAINLLALGSGTGFGSIGDTRYVIKVSATTFKLATTFANAMVGTAIDVTADATSATVCKARATATSVITVAA